MRDLASLDATCLTANGTSVKVHLVLESSASAQGPTGDVILAEPKLARGEEPNATREPSREASPSQSYSYYSDCSYESDSCRSGGSGPSQRRKKAQVPLSSAAASMYPYPQVPQGAQHSWPQATSRGLSPPPGDFSKERQAQASHEAPPGHGHSVSEHVPAQTPPAAYPHYAQRPHQGFAGYPHVVPSQVHPPPNPAPPQWGYHQYPPPHHPHVALPYGHYGCPPIQHRPLAAGPPPFHPLYGPPAHRRSSPSPDEDGSPRKKRRKGGKRRKKKVGEPPEKVGEDGNWEISKASKGLKLVAEMAPKIYRWEYKLKDESRRCYAGFLRNPVSYSKLDHFFRSIKDGTDWCQPVGSQGIIPRKTAWMVAPGCRCPYRYGGLEVQPQAFPAWMYELLRIYMPICGRPEEASWPNSCNINLYENGSQSVGWHSDDEVLFQGLLDDVCILSLSLGQIRKFRLKKNWPEEGEETTSTILLGNGALCTMEGMTQKHYIHCVPKENENLGPRINLTWRWVVKHAKACPKCTRE